MYIIELKLLIESVLNLIKLLKVNYFYQKSMNTNDSAVTGSSTSNCSFF